MGYAMIYALMNWGSWHGRSVGVGPAGVQAILDQPTAREWERRCLRRWLHFAAAACRP